MIYIVNCDKIRFFKTFKTFDEVMVYLEDLNKKVFDGKPFSTFGPPLNFNPYEEEDTLLDEPYTIDSVVLCPKDDPDTYFTFFIRCIDADGNQLNLV